MHTFQKGKEKVIYKFKVNAMSARVCLCVAKKKKIGSNYLRYTNYGEKYFAIELFKNLLILSQRFFFLSSVESSFVLC